MFKLLSQEDIKQIKKGEVSADFDPLFDLQIIPQVCAKIAEKLGWIDFDQVSNRTIFFSPSAGQRTLSCPFANLFDTPTPQVWQDTADSPTYGSSTLLVFNQDYTINKRLGWIEHKSSRGFVGGANTVKVTIKEGWVTNHGVGVPDTLRAGARAFAQMVFDRREALGLTGQSVEGGSMSYLAPMLRAFDIWDWLGEFRLFPDRYDT